MGLRSAISKIPVLAVATVEDVKTSPAQRQDCHVESPMGKVCFPIGHLLSFELLVEIIVLVQKPSCVYSSLLTI